MKKNVRIILYILIAIILLGCIFCIVDTNRVKQKKEPIFCIQTDIVNDGGSTIYMGLGYKIINYVKLSSPPYVSTVKVGTWLMKFENPFMNNMDFIHSEFVGTIVEIGEGYIVVTPDKGEAALKSADKIKVGMLDKEMAQIGRKVKVIYTGEIMESYPATVNPERVEYLDFAEEKEIEEKLESINSKQETQNINPNVALQKAEDIVTWEYTGEMEVDYFTENRPVYGFEFNLTYLPENGAFTAVPGMGDCDKVKYYTISNDKIIVAIDVKYQILYNFYAIHFNRSSLTSTPENWCENYNEGAKITKEGSINLIEMKFNKNYEKGEIKNLDISFGKID